MTDNEFVEFWNTTMVPKFLRFQHILVEGLGRHSRIVFRRDAVVDPGEKVLDVGAGFGDTAIELAQKIGEGGRVIAIDCCDAFLETGRKDAAAAGVENITWLVGDAESHDFGEPFDFWFSRFGTMFFASPVAAMRHLRRCLRKEGRMMMIVWRTIDFNEWAHLPKRTVLQFLPEPEPEEHCGPGPFSMGSKDLVTRQLTACGYDDIRFEQVDSPIMVGRSIDDAIGFALTLGPAGEIMRESGDEGEAKRPEIIAALTRAFEPYVTDDGVVLPSSSWCVTARNPG